MELRDRLTEVLTTIDLLPEVDMSSDVEEDTDDWLLPQGTIGLSDPALYSAILCQSLKQGSDYRFKMVATMCNTAVRSMRNTDSPTTDDVHAIAIAINILWAEGAGAALLNTMGLLGQVCSKTDVETPDLALLVFRGNRNVDKFGQLDPYTVIDGDIDIDTLLEN
jgi:hypothetical protein